MKRSVHVGMLASWLLGGCAAHMMLERPTPYGLTTLNNSPLEQSGQDFPCKIRPGVYDLTKMNYWAAGTANSVRFKGSAVHGGGSCQFSITTDAEPSKSSRWKVIDSRVGGCPASANGNLEGGPEAEVADDFEIVLPSQIPNGVYTFAWTWFNRIGDREMYMNCAPVTVSGGGSNATFLDSLPDMFVANLLDADCITPANFDFAFPDPGESVVTAKDARLTSLSEGGSCLALAPSANSLVPSQSLQGLSKEQASVDYPQTDVVNTGPEESGKAAWPAATPTSDVVVGATIDVESLTGAAIVMAARLSASTALSQSVTGNHDASSTLLTAPLHTPLACIPCSVEGAIECVGDDAFGLCDHSCVIPQALAAGTFCSNGAILRHRGRMLTKLGFTTQQRARSTRCASPKLGSIDCFAK